MVTSTRTRTRPSSVPAKSAAPKLATKAATKVATKPATKGATKVATPEAVLAPATQGPVKAKPKANPAVNAKAQGSPAAPAAPGKSELKLVRDSFTMPALDIARIDQLKRRTLALGRATKKSELLRAGLHALQALPDAQLMAVLAGLAVLKTGRPKKPG